MILLSKSLKNTANAKLKGSREGLEKLASDYKSTQTKVIKHVLDRLDRPNGIANSLEVSIINYCILTL